MPTLQIFGAPQSNFVWVTRIVAVEKGTQHELVHVTRPAERADAPP